VIPIGPGDYRTKVIETRKLSATQAALEPQIHIAKEKEAIGILGSWRGDETDQPAIWAPTIEKIEKKLQNWDKSNPTIGGRTKIIQMVVGGMTQYLTAVQGMPKDVEEYLDKRIKKIVWAGK
jgi:hypothetical protein